MTQAGAGCARGARAPECRIVLVDDDPAVRSSISFALEVEGLHADAFPSAEAALTDPQLNDCACLVLDHRLAGMDGLSLLSRLRARDIRAPAIVITSNPSRDLRERVRAAGAQLVEKPLLCGTLVATIKAIMAGVPRH